MLGRKNKQVSLSPSQRKEQREEERLRIDRAALGLSAISSTASAVSALATLGIIATMNEKPKRGRAIQHPYYEMDMVFDKRVKSTKSYIIDRYVNDDKSFILYTIIQKDQGMSLTDVVPSTREHETWWYSVTDSIAIPDDIIADEIGYAVKDSYRADKVYNDRMYDGLARYGYYPIKTELVRDIRRLYEPYATDCMFYFVG